MSKQTILLIFLFITTPILATAQDKMVSKLSQQLCKCVEKNKITSLDDMEPCFEQIALKNMEDLKKYYKVESIDDLDFDKLGVEIGVQFVKECDYIMPYLVNPINKVDKDFVPDENLDCSELRKGDFYYVQANPVTKATDTTYVTIKDKMCLERMENGKTYSLLDIQWVDDCRFTLIFQDSNDPIKSNLSKKSDRYEYEVMSSTTKFYEIKMTWKEQEYKFELHKIE